MSTRQVRYLLGERPTPAAAVTAHETAHPQIESHLTAADGTVCQTPLVVAVHTRGSPSTSRTGGRPHRGPHSKPDLGVPKNHCFDRRPNPRKKKVGEANHIPHTQVMPTDP